jgi:hypothetical protein
MAVMYGNDRHVASDMVQLRVSEFNNDAAGAFLDSLLDKIVAVVSNAADGKKELIGLRGAAVDRNAPERSGGVAGVIQRPADYRSQLIKTQTNHANF